jgi:ATP-dependent RNA helicase DeaD
VYYEVSGLEKERALIRIIEVENPEAALIFCNTKASTRYVGVVLQRFGYDAESLSAELTQKARERVLQLAYDRKLRFLVATDVAGRGIDISHLSHVFLYEFPEDTESYIHRAGRTGRAGAAGTAISLVDKLERLELKAVAKKYGIDMEARKLPTREDVQEVVSERVVALLENKLRKLDKLVLERKQRMMPLAKELAESEDEHAVLAMLLDEYYQKMLHSAPDVPDAPDVPEGKAAAPREERESSGGAESGSGGGETGGGDHGRKSRRGGRGRRGGGGRR